MLATEAIEAMEETGKPAVQPLALPEIGAVLQRSV
jgi:hypothetical protein